MIDRYSIAAPKARIHERFHSDVLDNYAPNYNASPTQLLPVIMHSSPQGVSTFYWGNLPKWSKNKGLAEKIINIHAESILEKSTLKRRMMKNRCLIPADGFYEWKQALAGGKQPIHVGMKDRRPFAFAGLTERWLSPEGEVLDTCTIVTTTANALLAAMHDRMPVIVAPADYTRWLDVACADVTDLLAPYPAEAMTWYPVSTRVNSVRNDDATLIEQVAETDATPSGDAPHTPAGSDDQAAEDEGAAPEQARLF